jgi:hypothetical protein
LTKKQPEDTKLLMLPTDLVDRLKVVSNQRGTSISGYVADVLEKALIVEGFGASVTDSVEAYRMRDIHKGAGSVLLSRSILSQIIKSLGEEHSEDLKKLWEDAGRWYGKYLSGIFSEEEVLVFMRQDLLSSWNLDEVVINDGDEATLRFTGFMMSQDFTDLLLSYVHGLMESLGYREVERDSLRGMASIKYIRL